MSARVVGVDLSLTSTGLADNRGRVDRVQTKSLPSTAAVGDVLDRIHRIVTAVETFARMSDGADGRYAADLADLIVVEGPSYASTGGQQHTRGGLWWVAVGTLDSIGSVLVVPPSSRAMYATGKGTSGKDAVLAAAIRRYQAVDITGNDVADATILAAIGARLLGHPIDDLPKTHLRALDKLRLPATLTATKED